MAFDRGDKDAAHLHGSRTDQQLLVALSGILPRAKGLAGKNECKPFVVFESANDIHHGFNLTPNPSPKGEGGEICI